MDIEELKQIPQTAEGLYFISQSLKIKTYLGGKHKVLERKDFTFKNETLKTSKIVLQTVKSIIDFHTSYICGNPITLSGNNEIVKVFNNIYKQGNYPLIDYKIIDNIVKFGNAFEYLYIDGNIIKSKIIDNSDSYPIYDDKGEYIAFVEHWTDNVSLNEFYIVYEPESVTEYSTEATGSLIQTGKYKNCSGLPIHYTSGSESVYNLYGEGIVNDLIPIIDEIEYLLSKTTDSVTTLSLNPLAISSGQRIESSIDKDLTGACLNLEEGGEFKYASANIDYKTVDLIIKELINQLYAVAQVPSVVFNGNVSNVSEVSLKLLFTQLDNKAKRTAIHLTKGFQERWAKMYTMLNEKPSQDDFNTLGVVFNYNRPTDNTAVINDLCRQKEAGALSKKSFIELSPYTDNAELELLQIEKETSISKKPVIS